MCHFTFDFENKALEETKSNLNFESFLWVVQTLLSHNCVISFGQETMTYFLGPVKSFFFSSLTIFVFTVFPNCISTPQQTESVYFILAI